MKQRFLCRKCRYIFDVEITGDSSGGAAILCQKCGSADVIEAPTWAPLGSGLNIFESDIWEYQCQDCKNKFKLPIPKSPAEGKSRVCIFCNSNHLHLMTIDGAKPLYCG